MGSRGQDSNSIAYSTNGTGWILSSQGNIFSSSCNALFYFNGLWVEVVMVQVNLVIQLMVLDGYRLLNRYFPVVIIRQILHMEMDYR